MDELERQALKLMKTGKPRKPRSNNGLRVTKGTITTKNTEILRKMLDGDNFYISTKDVEMCKWSFKKDTNKDLDLIPTEYDNIYKMKLV